tara:strand:- start:54 stop:257 length:204 start_codon:yes stop_codon:yes gene_type:complete
MPLPFKRTGDTMNELQNFFGDKGKNPTIKEMLEMRDALERTEAEVRAALYEIDARLDAYSDREESDE